MNEGLKLWQRAKKAIPGGNGLISKRPERYAPDLWPTYYSKANGVKVWDLEGNLYIDMAQMGIGSSILGYCDKKVDKAVKKAIAGGVNTTLNCVEEVQLAEKLLEIDEFASGVKFARTGGEAMAIAVRIARAYTGKEKIAFSGYHGWSDWYLASNLSSNESLNDHLLPGLDPVGVPSGLEGTVIPFRYNDIEDLEKQVSDQEIGAIIIEGARYDLATPAFLARIRELCDKKGAVFILDEISSGWRECLGGIYHTYDSIDPDMVVYGKAMGNGYPISAVLGTKEVMDAAQTTFISSTFWTERVGFVAALETINQLEKRNSSGEISSMGRYIGEMWEDSFKKFNIKAHVTEYKPLISFKLEYEEKNGAIQTYITQEMLKRGYLSASSVYVSSSHTKKIVDRYFVSFREVMKNLEKILKEGDLMKNLETRVKEEGFKRLT